MTSCIKILVKKSPRGQIQVRVTYVPLMKMARKDSRKQGLNKKTPSSKVMEEAKKHGHEMKEIPEKSADSSACWNQSQPTKTSRQSWPSRLSIHVRKSNPTETRGSLLLWGNPYAIFFSWGGGGGPLFSQPAHRPTNQPKTFMK